MLPSGVTNTTNTLLLNIQYFIVKDTNLVRQQQKQKQLRMDLIQVSDDIQMGRHCYE